MSVTHTVHAGDLAYATMDGTCRELVPVRVIEIHGDVTTDQNDLRVTVAVTGTRAPFERNEVLRELPANYIVARRAVGTRNGTRIVLRATIVVPSDAVAPDCGHVRKRPDGIGTGYATDVATGRTMCYPCADDRQRQDMLTEDTIVAYLSQDERTVTTWTGGKLARVTSVHPSPGNRRQYVHAVDDGGRHWHGSGPLESGTYVTLHRTKGK